MNNDVAGQSGVLAKYPQSKACADKFIVHLQCRLLAVDSAINMCHFWKAIRIIIIAFWKPRKCSALKDPRF
jgi:hypothetical protein